MKLIEKKLKVGEPVEFKSTDKDYGRAEFSICQIWKRNRLKKLYIYPHQQRDVKYFYTIETASHCDRLSLCSSVNALENPNIWVHGWCKEHNSPFIRFYVPKYSKRFYIDLLQITYIHFE